MADEILEDVEAAPEASSTATTLPADDTEVLDIRQTDGSGDLPPLEAPAETEAQPETSTEETAVEGQEAVQSLRDAAGELGYDVSNFNDDAQVLQHLVSEARKTTSQQQQLAQYQQMVSAQQQAQQPAPESTEDAPLWDPPPLDPMWLTQVQRDENGTLVPTAGGTQETVQKVMQWAQHRQENQDRFWNQPFEYIRPFVEQVAKEQMLTGLQSNQENMTAQQLINSNKDWLYEGDPKEGNFTADGQLFVDAVEEYTAGHRSSSPHDQYEHAMSKVEYARLRRDHDQLKQQQTAAATHQQKKQAAIGGNRPNSSGTLQDAIEQNPSLSLKERMSAALASAGIDSIDFDTHAAT